MRMIIIREASGDHIYGAEMHGGTFTPRKGDNVVLPDAQIVTVVRVVWDLGTGSAGTAGLALYV